MPITGKQFELGIDSTIEGWMKKIHDFLSAHSELAYTSEELAQELKDVPQAGEFVVGMSRPFAKALIKLEELGAVEARIVRDHKYYIMGTKPLEL